VDVDELCDECAEEESEVWRAGYETCSGRMLDMLHVGGMVMWVRGTCADDVFGFTVMRDPFSSISPSMEKMGFMHVLYCS
jgi:hypothetical protein